MGAQEASTKQNPPREKVHSAHAQSECDSFHLVVFVIFTSRIKAGFVIVDRSTHVTLVEVKTVQKPCTQPKPTCRTRYVTVQVVSLLFLDQRISCGYTHIIYNVPQPRLLISRYSFLHSHNLKHIHLSIVFYSWVIVQYKIALTIY